jgi:diguanylate cyclase (GGDEF)-like protein/PAS domain S-box-containing protein
MSTDRPKRILLIDAEATDRYLLKSVLERHWADVRVEEVDSHQRLLEALEAYAFDIIIIGSVFPDFTGLDVLEVVRRLGLDAPIIMLAAGDAQDLAAKAIELGADVYLPKTLDNIKQLPTTVRAVLERAAVRRSQLPVARPQAASYDHPSRQELLENGIDLLLAQIVTPDGSILYANRLWQQTLGYGDSELSKINFFDLIDPASQAVFQDRFRRVLAGEQLGSQEWSLVASDGRVVALEGVITGPAKDGVVKYTCGVFRDATWRKQVEEVLRTLHIASTQQHPFEQSLKLLLESGSRAYNLPIGLVCRVTDETCEIVQAVTPDNSIRPGDVLPLGSTFADESFANPSPVAVEVATDSVRQIHPGCQELDLKAFLGIAVNAGDQLYGALYFGSRQPRLKPFTATDMELLRINAQWIGGEIARRRGMDILQNVIEGTSVVTGEEYFRQLVSHMSSSLGVRCALAAEVIDAKTERARTLAVWADGVHLNNFEFDLLGTPAAYVVRQTRRGYASDVQHRFPEDALLARMNAQCYLGAPMLDGDCKSIGLLAVLDDKPLRDPYLAETILPIFATRASAELVRMRAEKTLLEEKERAQVTLHSIGDGVITTDPLGVVEYLNPVAEMLTGWRLDEAKGRPLSNVFLIIDEQTRQRIPDPALHCLKAGHVVYLDGTVLLLDRQGREYAVHGSAASIRGTENGPLGVIVVFKDVTETRRMMRQIVHQASHDALTGLVNRREFEERLSRAVATAKEQGLQHALLYLDLDHFKIVNDSAGHVAGDAVLTQVAGLLESEVRGRDTLARLGGDEFSLLLENCPIEKANQIAESILAAMRNARFTWQRRTFEIGASIGLVAITRDAVNSAQVLSQADVACYMAKDAGRNRVQVYLAQNGVPPIRHREIMRAAELSDALEQDRLRLYCQAIHSLGASNEGLLQYEILLRVAGDKDEVIEPGLLISAAERYGTMAAIDRWVITTAFSRYADIVRARPGAGIAINLSSDSLCDETLVRHIEQALGDYNVFPEHVCFEITETAALKNLEQAGKIIAALRRRGFRFTLDDFGYGPSSFAYLKQLPVDYLKIDGSFVRNMLRNEVDCALVAAINEVGHVLHILTIAECAESPDVVAELRRLGVDYAQGYALGVPIPCAEL